MNIEVIALYAVTACLVIGSIFTLTGAIGLLKFNNSMTRLHPPTKVGTVGIGALLLASIIYNGVFGEGAMHELLIMAFLFVTAPISANFIAKVNIHKGSCEKPPELPGDEQWATLDVAPEDQAIKEPTAAAEQAKSG
ncbi:monovalent cation/H(+) antiporter subunit G [Sulfitobacter donghicola]|uniref:Pesticidal protein Cry5Ba n=1 Tax=Sulfitobacter donghicola DSW-25 = KCTC 12864 = JCM 14565 TaxID=1300350 RepID=A0A073IJZ0_9RHOB|nr:monovalent cation/H(+) antiporter subunit G [Sulfitobacter donghicola]KEJ89846.1 pesticidal protein Cry5Ba [Sulfitobacter donghicola DSW-25 = KCTC 12864 = JCM 14565]KIN67033.1 putative potassium efflux system protein [Sulfitobacter donghicola DSW-25 = KCTC 12864 = JCM 14565]